MAKTKDSARKSKSGRKRTPAQLSLLDLMESPDGAASPAAETSKPKRQPRQRLPAKPAVERPAVLTPAEAALYLNIKPATLKSWRAKGVGPAFVKRAARLIGYTPAALDAYLAENTPRKV